MDGVDGFAGFQSTLYLAESRWAPAGGRALRWHAAGPFSENAPLLLLGGVIAAVAFKGDASAGANQVGKDGGFS